MRAYVRAYVCAYVHMCVRMCLCECLLGAHIVQRSTSPAGDISVVSMSINGTNH